SISNFCFLIALPDKAGLPPYCLSSHLLSCHRLLSPRFYRFCQLRGFGGGNVEGGFDGFGGIGVDPYSSANGNTTDGVCFSAVCRFDQGAAVEGAGVGFLKNSVLNILFQMKEMPSEN
ncbi:TPA: hypothetical protein ACJKC2_002000, partial [Neisseria meningitidis]